MQKPVSKTIVMITLFVLACAAADTAIAVAAVTRNANVPGFAIFGFHFGQIVMLALWSVCGRSQMLLRVVAATLTLILLAVAGSYCRFGRPTETGPWLGALTLYFTFLALPLSGARWFGFQLKSDQTIPAASRSGSKYQFSVAWLFSLTTGAAIVLAVARYMGFPWQELWAMVSVFAGLAINGIAILSCAMLIGRPERATGATVLVLPMSLVVGVLIQSFLVSQLSIKPAGGFIAIYAAQGATVAVSALVLRLAGLNLSREMPLSASPASGPLPVKSGA